MQEEATVIVLPAETTLDSPRIAKAARPQHETSFELRPLGARVSPAEAIPSDEPGYTVPVLRPVPRQVAPLPEAEPGEESETSAPHDTVVDLRAIAPRHSAGD